MSWLLIPTALKAKYRFGFQGCRSKKQMTDEVDTIHITVCVHLLQDKAGGTFYSLP